MKTDKKTLFRAIGEIDEKYVSEILDEDASGASVIKSFDAAKAATNAKKKASTGAKKFFAYYLPAVAGLLVCAVIVKSFMTSKDSAAGGNAASTDCAAPVPASEPMSAGNSAQMESAEAYFDEETDSIATLGNGEMSAASTNASDTYGGKDEDLTMDGMPNPFIDCSSLEEACEIAGINLVIPDDFNPGLSRIYRVMNESMIEVIFMDGDNESYRIRKGLISELGTDISGDYNEYNVSTSVDSADYAATLSGYAEDEYSVAIWNDEMYSYSITFEEPVSLSSATDIIDMIMAQ